MIYQGRNLTISNFADLEMHEFAVQVVHGLGHYAHHGTDITQLFYDPEDFY